MIMSDWTVEKSFTSLFGNGWSAKKKKPLSGLVYIQRDTRNLHHKNVRVFFFLFYTQSCDLARRGGVFSEYIARFHGQAIRRWQDGGACNCRSSVRKRWNCGRSYGSVTTSSTAAGFTCACSEVNKIGCFGATSSNTVFHQGSDVLFTCSLFTCSLALYWRVVKILLILCTVFILHTGRVRWSSESTLTTWQLVTLFRSTLLMLLEILNASLMLKLCHFSVTPFVSELCKINEHQKVALDLDPYVKKLLNARRRVVLVNNILQNAQVCQSVGLYLCTLHLPCSLYSTWDFIRFLTHPCQLPFVTGQWEVTLSRLWKL